MSSTPKFPQAIVLCAVIAATLLTAATAAFAQHLAIQHYNVEDGLGHSIVGAVYQDQKGYLWLGTADGLSRFDGYRFITYTTEDGLPSNVVTSIAEDRQAHLWIGTTGGLARLLDDPAETIATPNGRRKKFATYLISQNTDANAITSVFFEQDTLWCASDELYRAVTNSTSPSFERFPTQHDGQRSYKPFVDSSGHLWLGLYSELIEVNGGQVTRYGNSDGLPFNKSISRENPPLSNEQIVSITEDSHGRILIANRRELFEFLPDARANSGRRFRKLPLDVSSDRELRVLAPDPSGDLWIGTTKGLMRYGAEGKAVLVNERSIGDETIRALYQDREKNLWLGTLNGLYKTSGAFIVSYTRAEGLPDNMIRHIVEGTPGKVYVDTSAGIATLVNGQLRPSDSQKIVFGGPIYNILRDSRGSFWFGTSEGLYLVPGPDLDLRRARKISDPMSGLSKVFGLGLYEDPTGKLWAGANDSALFVFDSKRNVQPSFKRIELQKTVQGRILAPLHCAVADGSGALWFGWQADLGRFRNGRLELIDPPQGLTEILPREFLIDSRGWLWIGQQDGGALVSKDPTVEHPTFETYSTATGLSNNHITSITEDDGGRIYLITGKGLDRLDPSTGRIHHFMTNEGLAGSTGGPSLKDHLGNIWIGTGAGLSRLNPAAELPVPDPPPVFFSRLQIAGEDFLLPETGQQNISHIQLPASRNNLLVEFVGLDLRGANELRYQYELEGADKDWSPPSEQRSVNFARLAPGKYRLLVRTINSEGRANTEPSIVELQILSPIWQRWWFITAVMCVLVVATLGFYRMRVKQILALERIRRQVATDLHDDVGSGLAQIAVLSEVAKRETTPGGQDVLNEVAGLARAMRESMSDIVWAVDPRKDSLSDLVQRMRQATFNLLEANGIRVEFQVPNEKDLERINIAPDRRRHLLLIFKESITNVARHARARMVRVEVRLDASALELTVRDDGCGFVPGTNHDGNGLHSLEQRARELRGKLTVDSTIGTGTGVRIIVPVK